MVDSLISQGKHLVHTSEEDQNCLQASIDHYHKACAKKSESDLSSPVEDLDVYPDKPHTSPRHAFLAQCLSAINCHLRNLQPGSQVLRLDKPNHKFYRLETVRCLTTNGASDPEKFYLRGEYNSGFRICNAEDVDMSDDDEEEDNEEQLQKPWLTLYTGLNDELDVVPLFGGTKEMDQGQTEELIKLIRRVQGEEVSMYVFDYGKFVPK